MDTAIETTTASTGALSETERFALRGHEQVIAQGLSTFNEVGGALLAIRDARLYRATHPTFEAYCQERWGIQRAHAYRLMEASEVMGRLSPIGDKLPENEAQVRALADVIPEAQLAAWGAVVETAPDGKVTANHVAIVAHVFEEMLETGAIDPGDGIAIASSDILKAKITEETYERMQRQRDHIRESVERKEAAKAAGNGNKPKTNRAGDEYEAKKYDACQTPTYAVGPLLQYLDPSWLLWESAQGEGLLCGALTDNGMRVIGSDILTGDNFFQSQPDRWDVQVTNPPYSIKYKWLARSYELGKPFALLLPVETLGAATGQALFKKHGMQIILLDQRVNFKMPTQGWDGKGAQFPVAWFTWGLNLPADITYGRLQKGGQK